MLRDALVTGVAVLGLASGNLLVGTTIIETIFGKPGLGRLAIDAIKTRDYPIVQGVVLLMALAFVVVSLLTDLAYGLIDPRIRPGGRR